LNHGRLAEARHVGEGVKALVAEAPAAGGVRGAGERIADRVEVRGDVQPPDERVVAGIDDHGELAGPITRASPRTSLAAPVPPARATMFTEGHRL
jgi:hypothetical protein